MRIFIILLFSLFFTSGSFASFIKTDGLKFIRDGQNYTFVGANFWYGMNLGAHDRDRLVRELDRLQSMGVTNLRILAATEGPDDQPWRIAPALQKSPGVYDSDLLSGLDFLLAEMKKRNLTAVVMLGNYWQWSGGFAQYLEWAGQGPIPYPKVTFFDSNWFKTKISYLSWLKFFNYLKHFYKNKIAQEYYRDFLKTVITRYVDDPTIMAWELANEPIGYGAKKEYDKWIRETAVFIKSLDKNHLVTTGSVGNGFPFSGIDHYKNHVHPEIDYATVHIWVQNRGWYDPMKPEKTYPKSTKKMRAILDEHRALAAKLNKPLVLEEFGISRDENEYAPGTETKMRDQYFSEVFGQVLQSQESQTPIAGVNFWAWGGEAVPQHKIWQQGDPFTGDPPHEAQGWYSVYATDASTIKLVKQLSESLRK